MRAKCFLLGIIATFVGLSAATYVYFEQGFVSTRADIRPSILDQWLGRASESSIKRHATSTANPEPDTPEVLTTAAHLYGSRCAFCHGSPAQPENRLGESENPPAPQFFGSDRPDMTESQNFYVIKHGIRMTAMPSWDNLLTDQQIWQIVDLLKDVNDKDLPQEIVQLLLTSSASSAF